MTVTHIISYVDPREWDDFLYVEEELFDLSDEQAISFFNTTYNQYDDEYFLLRVRMLDNDDGTYYVPDPTPEAAIIASQNSL